MTEIWKDIKGYENLYQVSNLGNVKSLFRYKKILKKLVDKDGYLYVRIYKNKKSKHCLIHRLVAQAFIKKEMDKDQVNHIDFNKKNNVVSNLEWCNCAENIHHSSKAGRYKYNNAKKVIQYKDNKVIKVWNSVSEASEAMKIPTSNICKCCNGFRQTAGGYAWKH